MANSCRSPSSEVVNTKHIIYCYDPLYIVDSICKSMTMYLLLRHPFPQKSYIPT